jgi:hypothetical protein
MPGSAGHSRLTALKELHRLTHPAAMKREQIE